MLGSHPTRRPATVLPPASVTVSSPSSGKAWSAVTMSPGRQTKPLERERREWTETRPGAAWAIQFGEHSGHVLHLGEWGGFGVMGPPDGHGPRYANGLAPRLLPRWAGAPIANARRTRQARLRVATFSGCWVIWLRIGFAARLSCSDDRGIAGEGNPGCSPSLGTAAGLVQNARVRHWV